MIKPQQFVVLALATLVTLITSIALYASNYRFSTGKIDGTPVMPRIAQQEKQIASIQIVQGEKKLTLQRAGEVWRVAEREGYPASPARIRELMTALTDLQLVEPRTAVKDKWKLLELEDPAVKDAKSRAIRVLDAKGQALGDLVVGKARYHAFGPGKSGLYVRRPGEAQTWFAMGEVKGGPELKDWVALTAFEIASDRIARVTVEHPGEAPIVVEKGDGKEAKFKLAKPLPEGAKLKQGVQIDPMATGFASIELEDVRRLAQTPVGDKVSVLKLEMDGGPVVTFRLRKDGEASWLSFAAAGEGDAPKKAADAINARAAGWEFKIPQWKVDQIARRMTDLVEKTEEKKPEEKKPDEPKVDEPKPAEKQ